MKKIFFCFLALFVVLGLHCDDSEVQTITLTFAGDIMAHDTNYKMADYNKIYTDLEDILLMDDLTFGNMEMPICDILPMSSYPTFNVHSSYLEAAINGGFDVFALANNHTNDQGVKGIDGTLKSFANMKAKFDKLNENRFYFSGLKVNINEDIQPTIIEKKGFKILFLSVTELLNSYDNSRKRLYYSSPTTEGRQKLLASISKMRDENPCDLFILFLHLSEAEYGTKVSNAKKKWFRQLSKAGIDIIAASHPHVMQTWEKVPKVQSALASDIGNGNFSLRSSFFMYSLGNFISAQRRIPNYANSKHYREYTGDAILLQLTYTKLNGKVLDNFTVNPIPITVYKSSDGLVMRKFTDKFIENLPSQQDKIYYQTRLKLMKDYLPLK